MFCYPIIFFSIITAFVSCSTNGTVAGKGISTPAPIVPAQTIPSDPSAAGAILGEGDEITMMVWRQDNLKRSMPIDSTGCVNLPLAGQVKLGGMTVQQAREEIAKRISVYLVNPQVDITVNAVKSQRVHLLGEVKIPSSLIIDHRTTVAEVIAQGQGFTQDASKGKVMLIRSEGGTARIIPLDMDIGKIKDGQAIQANDLLVRGGDIVYVPPSKIASLERFLQHFTTIMGSVLTAQSSVLLGYQMYDTIVGTGATSGGVIVGQ